MKKVKSDQTVTVSNNRISFFVDGNPVPKQSFRYSKTGGYTDPRMKAWQDLVSWKAKEVFQTPTQGNVAVKMFFYLPTNRTMDLDNLSKGVLDGLKKIAFGDDSRVTTLVLAKKTRKENPGVFIVVEKERNSLSEEESRVLV